MKRKRWLYIALFLILIGLLTRIVLTLFVEPWIGRKLDTELSEKNPNYEIQISKVRISLISAGIELNNIIIDSKSEVGKGLYIRGKIASIRVKGISLIKALFRKSIIIRSITISESDIYVVTPTFAEDKPPVIIPINIKIDQLKLDKTHLLVRNNINSLSNSLTEGMIKVNSITFNKNDTLSKEKFQHFDFSANEIASVSADSMYIFNIKGIAYSSVLNNLTADTFSVMPSLSDYDFTSRFEFQKSRIESVLSNISVRDFHTAEFLRSGKLSSSYIEIGTLEMKVFRDKRKEFRHVNKPEFQEMIYSFPGFIRLDTISIIDGNISYRERAEKSNESGYITFNKINARILNITNDSVFKTKKAFLELKCTALFMGKGKTEILLKSKLFDSRNEFSVNGTLTDLDISEMNPYVENSAFVYITSGKLDRMDFSFTATGTESNGTMTMIYNGLDLAVKNKVADDTTAFKERLISLIVNIKVINSNPLPGKEVREGIIKNERDPERFLFNYCAKSILSGIKSSLL